MLTIFDLDHPAARVEVSDGGFSQTGQNATLTNASYNGTIAPGASITDSFQGTWSSNDTNPTSFSVNGAACR